MLQALFLAQPRRGQPRTNQSEPSGKLERATAHRPVPSNRRHKGATTRLTAPAYRKFDSSPSSRQSVSLRISPAFQERPRFSAILAATAGGRVARDTAEPGNLQSGAQVSPSGDIPVPCCPMRLASAGRERGQVSASTVHTLPAAISSGATSRAAGVTATASVTPRVYRALAEPSNRPAQAFRASRRALVVGS